MDSHFKPEFKRESNQALYEQLVHHFRTRILDGTLPSGTRLPSELVLADEYDISRGTIRQAMASSMKGCWIAYRGAAHSFVSRIARSLRLW